MSGPRHRLVKEPQSKKRARIRLQRSEAESNILKFDPEYLDAEMIRDEQCRRHFEDFALRCFEELHPSTVLDYNWHIGLVCEYLEACYLEQVMKVIFNMPTRTLKSMLCSVFFPAWILGKAPWEKILGCSYDSTLSTELSVYTRSILRTEWYLRTFPDTRLAKDQDEKRKYQTTQHGYRASTSIGGSITGRGGNYRIMDDPLDPEGGFSRLEVERANRFIDLTWSSRHDDPRKQRDIMVMQRLHVNDPTGHCLKQGGWTHIKIPQEAPAKIEISFPITGKIKVREQKELLHPDRITKEMVEDMKVRLGSYGFEAQQQQEPVPLGGGRIKMSWFPRYDQLLKSTVIEVVQSWDTANKGKEVNALSCCNTFMSDGKYWYWVDCYAEHLRYPELKKQARNLYKEFGAGVVLIEDKASGQTLIQDLEDTEDLNYDPTMSIIPINPVVDKITRMDTATPILEAGKLWIPERAIWLPDAETDLVTFPDPLVWDRLDALSQFLNWKFPRGGLPKVELW